MLDIVKKQYINLMLVKFASFSINAYILMLIIGIFGEGVSTTWFKISSLLTIVFAIDFGLSNRLKVVNLSLIDWTGYKKLMYAFARRSAIIFFIAIPCVVALLNRLYGIEPNLDLIIIVILWGLTFILRFNQVCAYHLCAVYSNSLILIISTAITLILLLAIRLLEVSPSLFILGLVVLLPQIFLVMYEIKSFIAKIRAKLANECVCTNEPKRESDSLKSYAIGQIAQVMVTNAPLFAITILYSDSMIQTFVVYMRLLSPMLLLPSIYFSVINPYITSKRINPIDLLTIKPVVFLSFIVILLVLYYSVSRITIEYYKVYPSSTLLLLTMGYMSLQVVSDYFDSILYSMGLMRRLIMKYMVIICLLLVLAAIVGYGFQLTIVPLMASMSIILIVGIYMSGQMIGEIINNEN